MVSLYNYLVRRPHVPRERQIRRLMRAQGLDVEVDPTPVGREKEGEGALELEDELEEDDDECEECGAEEAGEEEAMTDEECSLIDVYSYSA